MLSDLTPWLLLWAAFCLTASMMLRMMGAQAANVALDRLGRWTTQFIESPLGFVLGWIVMIAVIARWMGWI